jgi:L-amino acid N-acyltransferase YncA
MNETSFRPMKAEDLPLVLDIYNHYIVTTTATFHPEPITMKKLRSFVFLDHAWYQAFMILHSGEIAGFCFLTQFRELEAYDRTAELGIYLKPEFTRRGLGKKAVRHLEKSAEEGGLKVVVASISGENTGSIELFTKLGYEKCAHFRKIGEKWGRAIDVVFFQRFLENEGTVSTEELQ